MALASEFLDAIELMSSTDDSSTESSEEAVEETEEEAQPIAAAHSFSPVRSGLKLLAPL